MPSKPLTPERLAESGSEHAEQVALFAWAALHQNQYPVLKYMFAIPNGGERNIIVASRLKAEGVKAGAPDICLPVPKGPWHGLFVELKRGGKKPGKPSKDQLEMIEFLREHGYGAIVCVGWESAAHTIEEYLNWT